MREDVPPDDQIVEAETELFTLASSGTTNRGFQSFLSALYDAVNMANAAYNRGGKLAGISTGLTDMDRMLGGLHKSDLLILAGRPSMGKTSLATNPRLQRRQGLEARPARRRQRRAPSTAAWSGSSASRCRPPSWRSASCPRPPEIPSELIRKGDLTESEFERYLHAARDLERCPLFIDDTPALPIGRSRHARGG